MGFIRVNQKELTRDILYSPQRDGTKFSNNFKSPQNLKQKSYQKCWICEGWSSVLFKWSIEQFLKKEKDNNLADLVDENTLVYIHLSCDNYEGDLMEKDEVTGAFSLLRMIPPGSIDYYFSVAQPPIAN